MSGASWIPSPQQPVDQASDRSHSEAHTDSDSESEQDQVHGQNTTTDHRQLDLFSLKTKEKASEKSEKLEGQKHRRDLLCHFRVSQ